METTKKSLKTSDYRKALLFSVLIDEIIKERDYLHENAHLMNEIDNKFHERMIKKLTSMRHMKKEIYQINV